MRAADRRRRLTGRAGWRVGPAGWCVAAALTAACGGAGGPGPEEPRLDPSSPLALYPLQEGRVWSYDVDTGEGSSTLAITRVVSVRGARVEVSSGSDPVVYELVDGGIRHGGGGWLLRAPVAEGASWEGRAGRRVRVVADGRTLEVPAGRFEDCATVEERDTDSGRRIETSYCPGVGPVRVVSEVFLEVAGGVQRATGELLGTNLPGEVGGGVEVLSRPAGRN
jgi:hypothetical protein